MRALNSPLSNHTVLSLAGLFCAFLLSGCVSPVLEEGQAQVSAELDAARAACEAALSDQQALLDRQSAQLASQSEQLGDISEKLENLAAVTAPPPPIDCPAPENAAVVPPGKLMVGRRETVWLEELGLALPARIDTGAETASIDARDIELFERDGDDWVRFGIVHPQGDEVVVLERRLERRARIIQSNTEEAERRPVVVLGIIIGDVRQSAEFTLSNRSHLDYQVLVGRNILSDVMVVDVGQANIAPPVLPQRDGQ